MPSDGPPRVPGCRSRAAACDNPATMRVDDRFDDLASSLGGFYRSWTAYLGLELGFFAALREAGVEGLTPAELATRSGSGADPVTAWIHAAHAGELVEFDGARARIAEDVAAVLLDDGRPEYLGGQFVSSVVATLDYDGLTEFFRTGRTIAQRPPRFHRAIEQVTAQDIAVFFQEGLAEMPALTDELVRGADVLDVACGGGRWLVSVARQFPECRLSGVEFEPDSVARAIRRVADAGLEGRVRIEAREIVTMTFPAGFDLVYVQDALTEIPDPIASLRAAWAAVRPGGRLVVLDWCLPAEVDDYRTVHGQLLSGIQIDELFQGTRMYTHDGFVGLYGTAGLPVPTVIDLRSGATIFLSVRPR
jgi:SAM-dependent methyltransferase